ncbi:unnamed protein product, partial [Allacma fusca]
MEKISDLGISGLTTVTLLKEHYGKNHKVVVDNWFSSPALAAELRSNSTGILGTVRRNRKLMPKFASKLRRGSLYADYRREELQHSKAKTFHCFN